MTKSFVVGWALELVGTFVWLYGYLTAGHPSLIDWHGIAPIWISEWLPNLESEIGMLLLIVGMVPLYWPSKI